MRLQSVTGQYLSGHKQITMPSLRNKPDPKRTLTLTGARGNNLKDVTLNLPLGLFICVTGVSGSGKSTLINDTVYRAVARHIYGSSNEPAEFSELEGLDHLDKVVNVDQSPIGRTPRSNPATYTGLFTPVRELFAGVPLARERGYGTGRFSFNVKGGRCEACQGDGVIKVEMHFLPDIYVSCDICHGTRYNRETMEIRYKGKNIHDVLEMTVEQARDFFASVPAIVRRLDTLLDVGLGYVRLGQSAPTLSGRRSAKSETVAGIVEARYRQHAIHPGRTDHGFTFPGHRTTDEGIAPLTRSRQHGGGYRAQSRCHQDCRYDCRPGPGRRRRRRIHHRDGNAGGTGANRIQPDRPLSECGARRESGIRNEKDCLITLLTCLRPASGRG